MNNSLAILGGGESGVGVALLAKKHQMDVFLSDSGTIKTKYKTILHEKDIPYEEGGHSLHRILSATKVVKSPGIPDSAEVVQALIKKNIPILSEIEFSFPYIEGHTICVTGSNGKTTTTTLIHHIMEEAGLSVGLGGNIGHSLALQIAEQSKDWYVVELSSFQLDNCYDFRADIAVLMNITPDHLDRYDFSFQHYADSKMRIIQNQTPKDKFIYWAQDECICRELERRKDGEMIGKTTPSSQVARGGHPQLVPFVNNDFDKYKLSSQLIGVHNRRNVVAAYLATRFAGVHEEKIRAAIAGFKGVEHRLEFVATKAGVDYINDSKATNIDACLVALEAMTHPTILIVGGTDKGNDYSTLLPIVRKKCRALVFLGADNKRLHEAFRALDLPTRDTHSMAECVRACREVARDGDVVLLSPCCASFDLFHNMEDRGQQFITCVSSL